MAFSACFAETGSELETLSSGASASPPPRCDSAARTDGAALIVINCFVSFGGAVGRSSWGWRWLALAVRVRASDAAAARQVQCSPSGPREAALQSSVTAGQEGPNMRRSALTRSRKSRSAAFAWCTVIASVLHDASRRRAQALFALSKRFWCKTTVPYGSSASHASRSATTIHREPLKFKHSPLALWRHAALRRNFTKQWRRRRRLEREREWSGRRIDLPRDDARQRDRRSIIFLRRGDRELR